jgi:hypothetical protein
VLCWSALHHAVLVLCHGAVVDSAVPPNRIANAAAATQQHRDHLELQGAWSKFVKLFLQTAAEVSTRQPAAKPCHSKPARCSRTVPQLQGPPSSPCLYTRLVCISSVLWDLFHSTDEMRTAILVFHDSLLLYEGSGRSSEHPVMSRTWLMGLLHGRGRQNILVFFLILGRLLVVVLIRWVDSLRTSTR